MTEDPTLPEITSDEHPVGWGDEVDDNADDTRLLDERPPHHDRD